MAVVGSGAQGCVIAPALVFPQSEEINVENATLQVTKLGLNLWDEYDLGMTIKKSLAKLDIDPNAVGILPVDFLECGLSFKDIGFDESIVKKCAQVNDGLFKFTLQRPPRNYARTKSEFKDFERERVLSVIKGGLQAHSNSLTGGKSPPLWEGQTATVCAVQQPKFDMDFQGLIQKYFAQPGLSKEYKLVLAGSLYNDLLFKLSKIHETSFVHCDIKLPNLAFRGIPEESAPIHAQSTAFADFGLSVRLDNESAIQFAWERLHDLKFWQYYRQLGPPKLTAPDGSLLGIQWSVLWTLGKTPEAKINALRIIDWICLVGAMYHFFAESPSQQIFFLKSSITQINHEIEKNASY